MKFCVIFIFFFFQLLHRDALKLWATTTEWSWVNRLSQWASSSFKIKKGVKIVKLCAALKLTGMTFLVVLLHFLCFEIRCMWDWGKMVLFVFCTFSAIDLYRDLLFQRAALLLWSFCTIHIFLDICVGARILDSELLKCFCVMLASSYVMGTPDSATCSVFLPREAVVKGLLPRDEITPLFINEFCILWGAAEEKYKIPLFLNFC